MRDDDKRKEQALNWQREQTTQYNLRFMNATGIPKAINEATEATGTTTAEYLKTAVVDRLKQDGFFAGDVVLNLNKHRHRVKLARLKEYLAQEEQKIK